MKQAIKILFVIFSVMILSSCKKEKIKTDSDKIEQELKAFVSDKGISKCNVYLVHGSTYDNEHTGSAFTIDDGFVNIVSSANGGYEDRYNLLYLSRYRYNINNELELYFTE